MRWAIEQRLRFLEKKLIERGQINRADLCGEFRISIPQASKDIAEYIRLVPKNLDYDKSKKFYFRTCEFKPLFKDLLVECDF